MMLYAGEAWGTTSSTVIAYPYTGDYRIDVLLDSVPSSFPAVDYRWNHTTPLGSPVTVTYSFMTVVPYYGGADLEGSSGFSQFTWQQKAAVREIMARLDAELGLQLVEVSDSASSFGQIRFGNTTQAFTAGYAWQPNSTGDPKSGDVWMDDSYQYNLTHLEHGGEPYSTLLHEIGHALGLKHPGDYNAGSPNANEPGNFLAAAEDNFNYTLMSYTEANGGQERDWFAMYDLLALKALYGTGTFNSGPTGYSYGDSAGRMLVIINDVSGYDTLDLSALTLGADVDMRPGGFSSVGRNGSFRALDNLSIDFTTTIEKFIGTAYGDVVDGNSANNSLTLGSGANTADGREGLDTVLYSAPRSSFQAGLAAATLRVTGAGADDSLSNIERLQFADSKLAFDLAGNAGITAKILGAVFGEEQVSNAQYAGIGLVNLDSGMSYAALTQVALDAKLGASHAHGDVVTLLYTNVMGTAPAPDVHANYLDGLNSGVWTQSSLGIYAADSSFNVVNIDLAGLAQTGLAYL